VAVQCEPTAILPKFNLIVFNLLKYMYILSSFNPFVLDYMIDLCCINSNCLLVRMLCTWLN